MSEKELVYENFKHLEEGQHRVYCPSCHSKRKKHNQHQKELAVNIDSENIKYYCHHCGINGGVSKRQNTTKSTITSEKANEMMREIKIDTYRHTEKTTFFPLKK